MPIIKMYCQRCGDGIMEYMYHIFWQCRSCQAWRSYTPQAEGVQLQLSAKGERYATVSTTSGRPHGESTGSPEPLARGWDV